MSEPIKPTRELSGLIAKHFLGWRRIDTRLAHWPEPHPLLSFRGEPLEACVGPWFWPDPNAPDTDIPPFGCELPPFHEDTWVIACLLAWPLCKLGHGNGKNRAAIEIASAQDVRVYLCVEIQVEHAAGEGPTLAHAFLLAAARALQEAGHIERPYRVTRGQ